MTTVFRTTPAAPPEPELDSDPGSETIPDVAPGAGIDQPLVTAASTPRPPQTAAPAYVPETGRDRVRRMALRGRLHGYAIATVALVAVLIALAASNTASVKVNWLFGSSHVSLVWLVLVTAILGWGLGLVASVRFHWLTRAPRRGGRART